MLRSLRAFSEVSYVKTATLITAAVLRRHTGHHYEAHELCEAAVAVASGENIRLPFGPREAAVRKLLGEHVHFGTQFEDFIGRCLANDAAGSLVETLSDRERDVFQQLQTARTLHEIARELAVSINTVKTHQRASHLPQARGLLPSRGRADDGLTRGGRMLIRGWRQSWCSADARTAFAIAAGDRLGREDAITPPIDIAGESLASTSARRG